MGRTLENKQKIVTEIKSLLDDSEMAVVLDYKGLTIKEMSDLRSRLQTTNGICKVTKNSLMRKAIDGDSNWNDLESLLTGTNAFVLIKEDVGGAVKAIQSFQKDTKKSETKGALFEGRLLSDSEIKEIASLPSKEVLMAKLLALLMALQQKLRSLLMKYLLDLLDHFNNILKNQNPKFKTYLTLRKCPQKLKKFLNH